jgi:hypothetical protein
VNIGITTSTLPAGVVSVAPSPTTVSDVAPGGTADFSVTITGNGTASTGAFNINFVDADSGAQLGSVPVTIDCSSTPIGIGPANISRLYGTDAIGTSIAVSQAEFPNPQSAVAVVLARPDYFSDALAGGPLAAKVGGPLLITPGAPLSSSLDPRVLTEIQRVLLPGGTAYILGGDQALSPNIDSTLQSLGYVTKRIAGSDEYATAVDIAEQLGNPYTIFEGTGLSFEDALSAVPAAIKTGGAILLTDGATQAPETAAYLGSHAVGTRFAIGGPLAAYGADPSAVPVYGQDAYGTSAAVASTFFPEPTSFGAATSAGFQDAESGGVLVGMGRRPDASRPALGPVTTFHSELPLLKVR